MRCPMRRGSRLPPLAGEMPKAKGVITMPNKLRVVVNHRHNADPNVAPFPVTEPDAR